MQWRGVAYPAAFIINKLCIIILKNYNVDVNLDKKVNLSFNCHCDF